MMKPARLAGSRTERIANPAGLVVPGFWDDHVHFLQGGAHVAGVQLRDAATPAELIRRLKEFAARLLQLGREHATDWIKHRHDDGAWQVKRLPAPKGVTR